MTVISIKAIVAGGVMAMAIGSAASSETCKTECQIDLINKAQAVVMYHTGGTLLDGVADALTAAVRRNVRVEIFVGKSNKTFEKTDAFMEDFFARWNATAKDEDTTLLGMDACILKRTKAGPFLVTDPFKWGPNESPALVRNEELTRDFDVVSEAGNIVDSEEFVQCKLK